MIITAFSASFVFSIGVVIGYYGKEGEITQTTCDGSSESLESHKDKGWVWAWYFLVYLFIPKW